LNGVIANSEVRRYLDPKKILFSVLTVVSLLFAESYQVNTLSAKQMGMAHTGAGMLAQSVEIFNTTETTSKIASSIASNASLANESSSTLASTAEQMSVNMSSVAGAVGELRTSLKLRRKALLQRQKRKIHLNLLFAPSFE
jgi:hypothetical protein